MRRGKLAKIIVMVLCISLIFGSVSVSAFSGGGGYDDHGGGGGGSSSTLSVDHIDIKSAVAVTADEDGNLDNDLDVATITYVGYTTDSSSTSYTQVFSGTRTMGEDETRFQNLNIDISDYVGVKIEGTFNNGESFSVVLDTSSTYPDDTYYPKSGDNSEDLQTYYGLSTETIDGTEYYDISGYNVIEVAEVLCNGSEVSYGSIDSYGGIDFALNYETIKQYSLTVEKEVCTTLYSEDLDYTSDSIDWEDSASFTGLSEDTDTVEVLFKVTVTGTAGTDISELTDEIEALDAEDITLLSSDPDTLTQVDTDSSYGEDTFYYVATVPVKTTEVTYTNEAYIGDSYDDASAKDTATVTVGKTDSTDITVTKEWSNIEESIYEDWSVEVVLTVNGVEDDDYTATLSADNDWTCTWEDVEYNASNTYSVKEVSVNGSATESSGFEYTVTNSAETDTSGSGEESTKLTLADIDSTTIRRNKDTYSFTYNGDDVVLVTDGNAFVIWTEDSLSDTDEELLISSINDESISGIITLTTSNVEFKNGNNATYTYYVDVTKYYSWDFMGWYPYTVSEERTIEFSYDSDNIEVSFSDQKDWSTIVDGTYEITTTSDTATTIDADIDGVELGDRVTECNSLDVSTGDSVIFVKKGSSFYIWTPYTLTDDQKEALIEAIYNENVDSSFKLTSDVTFLSGTGTNISSSKISVSETTDGYTVSFSSKATWSYVYSGTVDYSKNYTVTNTLTDNTTDVTITKTWADEDTETHPSVTFTLYEQIGDADPVAIDTITLDDPGDGSDVWSYTFEDLAKYADTDESGEDGYGYYDTEIVYTVEETDVDGYVTVQDGYDFTNYPEPTKYIVEDDGDLVTSTTEETEIGDTITYAIEYYNYSSDTGTVTITDELDDTTTYSSSTNSGSYDSDTGTVTWTLSGVEAGASGYVYVTVTVNDNAVVEVENDATVTVGDNEYDTNLVTVPIKDVDPEKDAENVSDADMNDSDGSATEAEIGDKIEYTISYRNNTEEPANVVITDTLETGLTLTDQDDYTDITEDTSFDPDTASEGVYYNSDTKTITWVIENVASGSTGTVSFTARVNEDADDDYDSVENTATVTVGNEASVDTNEYSIPLTEYGSITITKGILGTPNIANGDAIFTYMITGSDGSVYYTTINMGSSTSGGTATVDNLPLDVTYTVTELSSLRYVELGLLNTGIGTEFEIELDDDNTTGTAAFTNSLEKTGWNSHTDIVTNHFEKSVDSDTGEITVSTESY